LYERGEFAAAGSVVDELVGQARMAGNRPAELRGGLVELLARTSTDPSQGMESAVAEAEVILEEAEALGDPSLLAQAQETAAWFLFWVGRSGDAEELLEAALSQAQARGVSDHQLMRLYRALAPTAIWGSLEAEPGLRRWGEIADETTVMASGLAHHVLATLHAMRGDFETARSHVATAEDILRELGATLFLLAGHPPSVVEKLAGEYEALEARSRAGVEGFEALGERGFLSTSEANLAEALLGQGRDREALEAARLSESHTAVGDVASEVGWRTVAARALARLGQVEEAGRLAREAVAIAERTDHLNEIGDAFLVLAEALRASGRPEEARRAAQSALERYERKGNVVSAERARRLIEEPGE
ncbi:MAG: tetratricopeptide repeat protein, partial [Actinomycetota bacterium]